jgi:hypothetical protein
VREKDKNFYAYFMPTAAEIRGRHRLALICRSALPRIGCGWNYELSMLIFLFHYGDFPSSQTGGRGVGCPPFPFLTTFAILYNSRDRVTIFSLRLFHETILFWFLIDRLVHFVDTVKYICISC